MPFVKGQLAREPDEGFVLFDASRRSKSEQGTLARLAERDELIAAALEWESVLDPVTVD